MAKFKVRIVETLIKEVEVEASDRAAARKMVQDDYYEYQTIVLGGDDWASTEFDILAEGEY